MESNSWNSPKERCIHTNLTKGGFLGLQWESMEGSVGLFDANENGHSVFLAAKFAGNALRGALKAAVFRNFRQLREICKRFVSASSVLKCFHFKIIFIPILGGPRGSPQLPNEFPKSHPLEPNCLVHVPALSLRDERTGVNYLTPLCFNLQKEDGVVQRIKRVLYVKHLEQCLDTVRVI